MEILKYPFICVINTNIVTMLNFTLTLLFQSISARIK